MVITTATDARKDLFRLIEKVNEDRTPVHITSRRGGAVLVAEEEWSAWQETSYLFGNPVMAQRLLESMERVERGEREYHDLSDLELED